MRGQTATVEVFLSHAPEDAALCAELVSHLSVLIQEGAIHVTSAGMIEPGAHLESSIAEHIERASLVLLLISADFLASPRSAADVPKALARHRSMQGLVVPVLLRDCDWREAPFGDLRPLPSDNKPVTSWENRSEALANIARAVRRLLSDARARPAAGGSRSFPLPSRAGEVRSILQRLRKADCAGAAVLAPFGFQAHLVAGEVLDRLKEPGEPLLSVRLVPELRTVDEERLYGRLLRDLRWAVPDAWRSVIDRRREASAMDRFEFAVEDLLDGPAQEAGRSLLLVVDELARVPGDQLEHWGALMARLSGRGLKVLVWGGQELYDLRTRPPRGGHASVFHVLPEVRLGPFSAEEVRALVLERGGDEETATVVNEVTWGHPALVNELLDGRLAEVRDGGAEAGIARVLRSNHLVRLRGAVVGDEGLLRALTGFARAGSDRAPRGWERDEERIAWLGVVREVGAAGWAWTAPVMARFAAEVV